MLTTFLDLGARVFQAYRRNYEAGRAFGAIAQDFEDVSGQLGTLSRRALAEQRLRDRRNRDLNDYVTGLASVMDVIMARGLEDLGETFVNRRQARRAIVRAMKADDIYVAPRERTYGANPADNVVGIHRRVTTNEFGERIENGAGDLPAGALIRVSDVRQLDNGFARTRVTVSGSTAEDADNLNLRPARFNVAVDLVGPENTAACLNANPLLAGLAAPSDMTAIGATDIDGWEQDRTSFGSMVMRARTTIAFRSQPYGVGFSGPAGTVELTQSTRNWRLNINEPTAWMIPARKTGNDLVAAISGGIGQQSAAFDHTDVSSTDWSYLVGPLDENAWPRNWMQTPSEFHLEVVLGPTSDDELVLGGIYVARMFQPRGRNRGGDWHIYWERAGQADVDATARFGADTGTDDGAIQDLWCRIDESGPSLPVAVAGGGTLWQLPAPVFATASLPGGTDATPYSQNIALDTDEGLAPYRLALIDGALPDGVNFTDNGNGTATIAGTPTETGPFPLVVQASDAAGERVVKLYTLTIT